MSRVAVVTDSTACVGAVPLGADLRVVQVLLLFTDHEACDHEVDPGDVYERLARGETIKSQAPPAAAYLEAIEAEDHDGVLVLTPADEFTVMAHHARLAAELAARPTAFVDTRTAAAGHGLVVRAALAAAREGGDLDQVSAVAREAADRVELVAALYEPSYLERSGHIHAPSEVMIARFRDGHIVPLAAGGEPLRALASSWRKGGGHPDTTLVFHSALSARAERLWRSVGAREPVLTCGAAMGAHVGPGLVGVAWLR